MLAELRLALDQSPTLRLCLSYVMGAEWVAELREIAVTVGGESDAPVAHPDREDTQAAEYLPRDHDARAR